MRMATSGNTPRSSFDLVFHFRIRAARPRRRRLGRRPDSPGATGWARFYARDGQLVQAVRTPPGLYVTEASHRLRAPPASAQPQPAARLLPGPRSRTEWNMMRVPHLQRPGRPVPRRALPTHRRLRPGRYARSSSNTAEICDADGSYHELADCDDVSERERRALRLRVRRRDDRGRPHHRAHLRARERGRCGGRRWAMKGYLQSLPVVGKIFSTSSPRRSGRSGASCRTTSARASSTSGARSRCSSSRAVSKRSASRERPLLKNFTTTIGRRIYTPFEVGSPKGGWDLWHQIVICVHEHQHVVQHDREGLAYEVSYLADRRARPLGGRGLPLEPRAAVLAHGHHALGAAHGVGAVGLRLPRRRHRGRGQVARSRRSA